MSDRYDVVVIGGGNAGFSAAHAARETGAEVLVVEKAPPEWAGGNTYFTAGAYRLTYGSVEDLRARLGLDGLAGRIVEIPPYLVDDFVADMRRVTHGRCDPTLTRIIAEEATPAAEWLAGKGVRWALMFERQSFLVDRVTRFWGNLPVGVEGGGHGLCHAHARAAKESGIEVSSSTALKELQTAEDAVTGVTVAGPGGVTSIRAGAVVLAAGGFQADARLRAAYLGPRWELAKVRGTPFNTGEVLHLALALGCEAKGHWSGCHSIAWDAEASDHGDRVISNRWSRQAYPFGLVINTAGRRFLDEGADFRNYTYAKYGAEILEQPGAIAYQLFDSVGHEFVGKVDYETAGESRTVADSITELARRLGVDEASLRDEVTKYNAALEPGRFDPTILDGKRTRGLLPPKSNWAMPLDVPPFYAYRVTCGITFTFGGLSIDAHGGVLKPGRVRMKGLYAAGEIVGGIFYHNYPGGSGLAAGTVMGRRAGTSAAQEAMALA